MFHIRRRRAWDVPGSQATPERDFLGRREFLRDLGKIGAGLALGSGLGRAAQALAAGAGAGSVFGAPPSRRPALYPAKRNPAFQLDRPLTAESVVTAYNNFYEFSEEKAAVKDLVGAFQTWPWRIQVAGLVEKPREIDLDDLLRALPVEERLYRHRCVEAWAMAVPWTGIPMREFVKWAAPRSEARYLRMVSFLRPDQAPNQKQATWYPWPYFEGLRLEEARNELALLAVGLYGHDLPKQDGAPFRLVVPWKYGFKSIKSIVRFEFTAKRPRTFWNDLAPSEYDFDANVNPAVPHPRWSQATERMIGTDERRPTLPFNGYGAWVAGLYPKT
ncbi:MAG TPA: protein-methionine-sulfoxide reductase catalytic subunit MsrP [Candidatus Saccharimonadales bacterium]|nr:protein-methionine-sulfoxide reductase catalytic subunit MsrP [Candidatus Saccharimonadales bacterium]